MPQHSPSSTLSAPRSSRHCPLLAQHATSAYITRCGTCAGVLQALCTLTQLEAHAHSQSTRQHSASTSTLHPVQHNVWCLAQRSPMSGPAQHTKPPSGAFAVALTLRALAGASTHGDHAMAMLQCCADPVRRGPNPWSGRANVLFPHTQCLVIMCARQCLLQWGAPDAAHPGC